MPWWLALCDLGDPGWGDPWFPHSAVLLHSHAGMAMWTWCLCVLSLFGLPYQYLSWYNAITSFSSLVTELDRRSLSPLRFWCLFFVWFWFCLFCCFGCCLFIWCVFAMTAAGLCTGPIPVHFCGPQPDGGYMYALISQFTGSMQHATERVERPGESQEALDGKKICFQQKGCLSNTGRFIFAGLLFLTFWKPKKGIFFVTLFWSNFHSASFMVTALPCHRWLCSTC